MIQQAMYEILRGLMLALVRFDGALVLANRVVVTMFGVIGLLSKERGIDVACIEVSINVGGSFCVVNPSLMTGLFSVVAGLVSVMFVPLVMMNFPVVMYSFLTMDLLCAMNFPVVVAFLVVMGLWVVMISLVVIVIVVLSVVAASPCVCGFLSTSLFSIMSSHGVLTGFVRD